MKSGNQSKNCVILYSRRHFDPNASTNLENSSAGIIARTLYEEMKLHSDFDVYYFDSFDSSEWRKIETDTLISLVDNLSLGIWFFKPKDIIVIAVNQHPLARLQICGLAARKGIPASAITPSDGAYQPSKDLVKAKAILCVGNEKTKESFERFLKRSNVIETTYRTSFINNTQEHIDVKIENILILMSSIGYRKGFDLIFQGLMNQKELLGSYKFHLIGHSEGPYWSKMIEYLKSHNENFTYHGWLLNSDEKFEALLQKMDVAIFPTREEGLVGSLLECIDLGIISLHTRSSGLNNSVEELEIPSEGNFDLAGSLSLLASKTNFEIHQLRERQRSDVRHQFSNSLPIEVGLRLALQSKSSEKRTSLRPLKAILVWLTFPNLRFIKIVFGRFKLITIRLFLVKLSLERPSLYKKIRCLYRYFK
jgi:hypothetical protein